MGARYAYGHDAKVHQGDEIYFSICSSLSIKGVYFREQWLGTEHSPTVDLILHLLPTCYTIPLLQQQQHVHVNFDKGKVPYSKYTV